MAMRIKMFVKVLGRQDTHWREYIINTDNIVEIWYNEYYCIEFANDDIGIWVNQDSYDKIIAAVGGLYNKESSQLSPKAYQ